MKKLLIFIPSLEYGGAEKFIATLLNQINSQGLQVDLLLGEKKGCFINDIPSSVTVHHLGQCSARKQIIPLFRFLMKNRYQVVLSSLGACVSLSIVKLFMPYRLRICCRLGNTISTELNHTKETRFLTYYLHKLSYRIIALASTRIIAQCHYMKDDFLAWFSPKNDVAVIYNGCDIARIDALSQVSNHVVSSDINLVMAGAFNHQKNHELLLNALALSLPRHPTIKLHLLGDGDRYAEMVQLAHQLQIEKQIVFHGMLSNPYSIIASSDFFVLPSRYEGFSNAVIESLILGVPVVVTPSPGGNAEVVNTHNGFIASGFDPDSFSCAINHCIANKQQFDQSRIRRESREKYGVESVANQYMELIQELY